MEQSKLLTTQAITANRQLPTTPHVPAKLQQYTKELQEIVHYPIGRPARMYHAYKEYSLSYNIELLTILLGASQAHEQEMIMDLLNQYTYAKNNLTFKSFL